MNDKYGILDMQKSKKMSHLEQGFNTGKIPVNIIASETNKRYLIAEFCTLLSGSVMFWTYGRSQGYGSQEESKLVIVDENGIEIEMYHTFGTSSNVVVELEAGKKYKFYVYAKFTGGYQRIIESYQFTGSIIDTTNPILIKNQGVIE